jgi:hypothetical protein
MLQRSMPQRQVQARPCGCLAGFALSANTTALGKKS